jgi:hypothetical protein
MKTFSFGEFTVSTFDDFLTFSALFTEGPLKGAENVSKLAFARLLFKRYIASKFSSPNQLPFYYYKSSR